MKALDFIRAETAKCLDCGACRDVCDIAGAVKQAVPASIALHVAEGDADERMQWFVPRCSLCGRCSHVCPESVDTPSLMVAARSLMARSGSLDVEKYQPMFIDNDWNAISLYREVYGVDVSERYRNHAPVAFMPGCSLLNVAPDAVLKTHDWLEETLGCPVALVDRCCGMPLQEMGLLERYEAYLEDLFDQLMKIGARKLIVACPNCLGRLAQHGSRAGITTQIVYEPMAAMGLRAPIFGSGRACVHDSCPARGTQIGTWVRSIIADWALIEFEHQGDCSQCCGSGGAVGMYDSVLSQIRASRRKAELAATGADVCVAYCMSSVSTLYDEQELPNIRHVLELVFDAPSDHAAYAERVQQMWQGDVGRRCDTLLRNALRTTGAN